jgi:hypothetical protein
MHTCPETHKCMGIRGLVHTYLHIYVTTHAHHPPAYLHTHAHMDTYLYTHAHVFGEKL